MKNPEMTVLMSVYNGSLFLKESIESILNQTFVDFEFIIIDDGSKDGSFSIINSYAERDDRIVLLRKENSGLAASLNIGIQMAKSNLIARMDADDIAVIDRLEKQYLYMKDHSEVGVLGGGIQMMSADGKILPKKKIPQKNGINEKTLLTKCVLYHPTVVYRKNIVSSIGGYRPAIRFSEDRDLWFRLSEVTTIENLTDVVLYYRNSSKNITSTHGTLLQPLCSEIACASYLSRKIGIVDFVNSLTEVDKFVFDKVNLPEKIRSPALLEAIISMLNNQNDFSDREWYDYVVERFMTIDKSLCSMDRIRKFKRRLLVYRVKRFYFFICRYFSFNCWRIIVVFDIFLAICLVWLFNLFID